MPTGIQKKFRVVSSEIFEISAENGERIFNVHKDALIAQSEPFRNAITGGWRETTERKINLNDWDGETVGRLVEFLYIGNYQYPDPVSSAERAGDRTIQGSFRAPRATRDEAGTVTGPNRPLTPLAECLDGLFPQERDDGADWSKLAGFDSQDDYKDALLSNAKVYCLAQYKSISALRSLALRRIFLILQHINPLTAHANSHAALNVVDLIAYVYSNTDSLVSSEEPLRKLLSQFAAHNLQALQSRPEMMELMSEGGDFVNELMPKICRRLIVSPASPVIQRPRSPVAPHVPHVPDYGPKPSIGYFNTGEVHHWRHPWPRTSKIVSFGKTYPTPPDLPVGINTMDIGNNGNIRISAYPSNAGRDRFTINIDSWLETRIYSAGCAWLQIPSMDQRFQSGKYSTTDDHPHHQTKTSRLITFPWPYTTQPTVVVMLATLDMAKNKSWRVRTYVTNVTLRDFVIHIDTWDDTVLHAAAATWIAYPAGMPGVASGRFDTRDVRSLHPPQLNTGGHVSFGPGVFTRTPHALLAFDSLDIDCRRNMRVRVDYSNMTTAGMNWHISGWGNTIVYAAGAAYIALT